MISRLAIRAEGPDVPARQLSGGNQQKVVLGKWLAAGVQILLMDEPDRGIDIGAKAQIHDLVRELAADGMSVLITSSELDDLVSLCDRILVLNDGRITHSLTDTTVSELLRLTMARHAEDDHERG
jgi:ribose transport system ATP-binding protein